MAASSSPVFKGQTVTWGTNEVSHGFSGICTAADVTRQGPNEAVEDENGARIGIVIYDESYSGTITVVCKAGCSMPPIGAPVTLAGLKGYVTDARFNWQNKGMKQMTVSFEGGKYVG